jgi:hypothetical protein
MSRHKFTGIAGLPLGRRAVRMLRDHGIFARSLLSVQLQQLVQRYVMRGLESGGSAADAGRYVTFSDADGFPLEYLQPVETIVVNGPHAVVISTDALIRADMFRKGQTYELLITRHWLSGVTDSQKPQLACEILFRGIHGRLELGLSGKEMAQVSGVVPRFYSLAGGVMPIPDRFVPLVSGAMKGVNCRDCSHTHYLRKPDPFRN